MKHRIITITTIVAALTLSLGGCKPPDTTNTVPVESAGNGNGTGNTGDTGGTGGSGSGSGSDTTGEDFPCGEGTYLHQCAFVILPWYVADNGADDEQLGTLQTLNGDANPKLCFSSEASGGSSPAQHVPGGLVCGGSGVPSEQACQDLCDGFDVAGIVPAAFDFGSLVYTYSYHECAAYDAGAGLYDGTCAEGLNGDVTITSTPCSEDYCEEPEADSTGTDTGGGQELDCTTYDTHGNLSVTVRGRTNYAVVDESWADHLLLYPGDVFKCDSGHYDWTLTPHEFFGIKPGSFLYAAGVRSGDEIVEAWEHDGSHDVVPGTRITITDYDDALGILALFPATGADLALSFKVQRGAQAYTFHLDPR